MDSTQFPQAAARPCRPALRGPLLGAAALLLLAGVACCAPPAVAADLPAPPVARPDAGVAPGDDFARYVNGAWEARTVIPADHGNWGTFAQMTQTNWANMATLYREAARNAADPAAKRVGDYYAAQMDEAGIETRAWAPLAPVLARIAALEDKTALARFLGGQLRADVDPLDLGNTSSENLFGLWVAPGLHDTGHYLPYLLQGGLGLPDPTTYSDDAPDQKALRALYRDHIAAALALVGIADADAKAERILELETRIAKVHASAPQSQDAQRADHQWRRADFANQAPGLDWDAYFDAAGLAGQAAFGGWQPEAIKGIAAQVAATPLDIWQDYLRFHALNTAARVLPKAVSARYFALYDPLFLGPGQHLPRWIHVVNATNTVMPGAGRLFVERYFPPSSKAKAQEITDRIVAALRQRIGRLAWMAPATRAQALAKLDAMAIGVGYPDTWRGSEGLDIRADDAYGNAQRVSVYNYRYELAKLGRPVDRREWILGAELFGVNRMPLQNAMTIPAFDLQPPFFDPRGSDALNYAAIGARIGHFLSLAFNERGGNFDAAGQLRRWWGADDLARFKEVAAPLVTQYSAYRPFPDLALDGRRTLGQNSADLAGLQLAYDAYRAALADRHVNEDGRTLDRRFFTAYAESFREKNRAEDLRGQSAGSPVAPAPYRIATVRNLDAWYAAFDVTPTQRLYLAPVARAKIW